MEPDDLRETVRRDLEDYPAGEILRAYLEQAGQSREVSWKAKARRAWSKAEKDVHADLTVLAKVIDDAHDMDEGELPSDAGREELLGTFAKVVVERFGALPRVVAVRVAKRLRLVPPEDESTPSWEALYELLAAFDGVMSYSDDGGRGTHLPPEAERFLDVSEAARASRRSPPTGPSWAALKRRRKGQTSHRPYSIHETFAEGDWISHTKFGEGVVVESGDTIRVLFEDSARALAHTPPPKEQPAWFAPPAKRIPSPPIVTNVPVHRLPPDPRLSDEEEEDVPFADASPRTKDEGDDTDDADEKATDEKATDDNE